jgi:homocitrate synthase NifV
VVKKDQNWLFGTLPRLVEYCKAQGVFVSVSAEDASRTPPERLLAYARLMREAGADRIRISDTLGLFNPLRAFSGFVDNAQEVLKKYYIALRL